MYCTPWFPNAGMKIHFMTSLGTDLPARRLPGRGARCHPLLSRGPFSEWYESLLEEQNMHKFKNVSKRRVAPEFLKYLYRLSRCTAADDNDNTLAANQTGGASVWHCHSETDLGAKDIVPAGGLTMFKTRFKQVQTRFICYIFSIQKNDKHKHRRNKHVW